MRILDCSKHRKVICEICSTLYVLNYFVLYTFLLFLDTQNVQVVEALLLLEAVYPTWTPWLLMTWWHIWSQNISRNYIDRVIQLTNDAIITSLWRQNDVATSFRRHNDVIIASCVRWHALQTDIVKSRSRDIWSYPIEICQAVEKPVIFKVVIVVSFISNRIQQWNNTRKKKHFVDISKHIETLLHLSMVTREAAGLTKLATKHTQATGLDA